MEVVDLRGHQDEGLLREVHDGLYVASFPRDEERESLEYWLAALWGAEREGNPRVHALVAGSGLREPGRRHITGLAFCERYLDSATALLSYLAVERSQRHRGVGRTLVKHALDLLADEAAAAGAPLKAVFGEIHDPAAVAAKTDVMDPAERVSFFASLDAARVPLPYVQPALAPGKGRARGLHLIVLPRDGRPRALPAATVRDFIAELYRLTEGEPAPDDDDFGAMLRALDADVVELEPFNCEHETPSLRIERYGIAFEYVARRPGPVELGAPRRQFESFERDVLAHAYRDERPFSSSPIPVPQPCRQVVLELAEEVRFVSEGRTCTLVAGGPRRLDVQVRASRTDFRTGITVWHLVLTPRAGSAAAWVTEYDVIKLAKLWEGGEAVRGPFAGEGAQTAVRFVHGERTWTLDELAREVLGPAASAAGGRRSATGEPAVRAEPRLRGGIVQLIVEDAEQPALDEAWNVIDTVRQRPALTTSYPFRDDDQRALVESIAGVVQGLIDFREIDEAELSDVFAGIDVGADGLRGIHKGTLVSMSASDRTWEVGRMSYGVSPYLLLPHAVLLHNEEVLRAAGRSARRARGVRSPSAVAARRRLPFVRRQVASATHVRASRKALRDARRHLHEALERDLLPNVFHYPNERRIYELGAGSRGLTALADDLRRNLAEFNARWESGASMRRTTADDLKAALLFVIAGLALREYIDATVLLAVFGIGGLVYLVFRLYTWR